MKCIGRAKRTIHRNEESYFTIAAFELVTEIEGDVHIHPIYKTFTATGVMPYLLEGEEYVISASEAEHKQYGKQYTINSINLNLPNGIKTKEGQKDYLKVIFTEGQVKAMYEALSDPYKALKDKDASQLVKVKGCGVKTAAEWIERFSIHMPMSNIMSELSSYGLTEGLLKKIVNHYKSSDIAIEIIKKNPYKLIEVKGLGWKKCDEVAVKGGMDLFSPKRIGFYIIHYLTDKAMEGYTYVPTDYESETSLNLRTKNNKNLNLMDNLIDFFGDDLSDDLIGESLREIKSHLWLNEDRTVIGLLKFHDLEKRVAEELIRLRDGENRFKYGNWKDIVKKKEEEQGWNYAPQQMKGIEAVLKNQVTIITGEAGTGKSSIVDAMIAVLNKYSFAQTALSGRAAARMAEITGEEGYTIHRLLGFPKGDPLYGRCIFHTDNKLPFDIVILDEISMVDGQLFLRLIQAIKTGAKLIMLGDVGQLECIGCMNIAADLIKSDQITSVELNEIHRQAAKSAIVTEGRKARHNTQLIEKDWVGTEIRGERKDLLIDCYSDKSNTFYKMVQYVSTELEKGTPIMDLMVIVANKANEAGTYNLNSAIQELYNPHSDTKKEVFIETGANSWFLREGDKIINVQNNYEIGNEHQMGIFNGNLGVITKINTKKGFIYVDFTDIKGEMKIPKKHWKCIELGYCITCHKAQGSQCKNVIVGLDFGSFTQLSKEWVYTAITRAEKKCLLIAQNNALRFAIAQNSISSKLTLLVDMLKRKEEEKFAF